VGKFAAGLIIVGCVFGSVLIGMFSQRRLPEHHTSKESQEVIGLEISTIATLSALVVGLLIATAKTSYELKDFELKQSGHKRIRELLRRYTVCKINSLWRTEDRLSATESNGWRLLEDVLDRIRALKSAHEAQRWLQSHALLLSSNLAQGRWLLLEQEGSSIPMPFLIVLVFWLLHHLALQCAMHLLISNSRTGLNGVAEKCMPCTILQRDDAGRGRDPHVGVGIRDYAH
jgi:hypothetical protein